MQRLAVLLGVLAVVGGLGVVGAGAGPLCDVDHDLPEALPVLEAFGDLTLAAPEDLPLLPSQGLEDTHPCSGKIRPGVRAVFNNAWVCTLNWIYQDAQGALYIGTAGHCAPSHGAMTINVAGIGDIGDVAFTTGNRGVGNDFALIAVTPALYHLVDATLCHWGGPGGTHTTAGNQVLAHFGHGTFWGQSPETQGRLGVVRSNGWSSNAITFTGSVGPGDSGSPIRVVGNGDGAAGVITHTSSYAFPHTGTQYANRVDSGLARANAALPAKAPFAVVPGEAFDPGL
jgi:hypothetical protein